MCGSLQWGLSLCNSILFLEEAENVHPRMHESKGLELPPHLV